MQLNLSLPVTDMPTCTFFIHSKYFQNLFLIMVLLEMVQTIGLIKLTLFDSFSHDKKLSTLHIIELLKFSLN